MKLMLLTLIAFLLAFAGLAAGLLLRGRGLRSSCGSAKSGPQDCRCETDLDHNMRSQGNCHKNK